MACRFQARVRAQHWTRRLAALTQPDPQDPVARLRWTDAYPPASAADGGRVRAYGTSSGSKLLTYVRSRCATCDRLAAARRAVALPTASAAP